MHLLENVINRTFTIVELGKSVASMEIILPVTEVVEVLDLKTRAVLRVAVADVSIYRHTLHLNGKSFNITNVTESM